MSHTTTAHPGRVAGLAALAIGATSIATLAQAPLAHAQQFGSFTLAPGATACVQQYASYQVRGDGWASRPVKFSLKKNGMTLNPVPAGTYWAQEYRVSYGTFPGSGFYQVCAFNNGTQTASVQIQIRTDYEF
ncbi:MAG: hypothetical protein ACLGHZ_02225 [Actinomycetes bacterium]